MDCCWAAVSLLADSFSVLILVIASIVLAWIARCHNTFITWMALMLSRIARINAMTKLLTWLHRQNVAADGLRLFRFVQVTIERSFGECLLDAAF